MKKAWQPVTLVSLDVQEHDLPFWKPPIEICLKPDCQGVSTEVPSSPYFQLKSNQEPDTNIHDSTALWLFFKIFVMLWILASGSWLLLSWLVEKSGDVLKLILVTFQVKIHLARCFIPNENEDQNFFWSSLSLTSAEAIKLTQSEMYWADNNLKEMLLCSKLSKMNGMMKKILWGLAMNDG